MTRQQKLRKQQFNKWWKKNSHAKNAHTWLAHFSRDFAFMYCLAPAAFAQIQGITKRFFNSEYRRFTLTDANTLWRLIHPTSRSRTQIMMDTAEFLHNANLALKVTKKEVKTIEQRRQAIRESLKRTTI